LAPSVTDSLAIDAAVSDGETVNVTKNTGTAPASACVRRSTADGAGALPGALVDDVAVMVVPAIPLPEKSNVAVCPPTVASATLPPPAGIVNVEATPDPAEADGAETGL
jgi:hypothetical protein